MSIKQVLTVLVAAAALHSFTAPAQDLFRLTLKATGKSIGSNGRISTTRITDRTIVDEAIGNTSTVSNRFFALAYNAASDTIQVVDTNGNDVADVIQFQGGQFVSDGNTSVRLTFMFVPDQTDSIGTAILTERAPRTVTGTASDRANISGTLQFALNGDTVLGGATNSLSETSSGTTDTNGIITLTTTTTTANTAGTLNNGVFDTSGAVTTTATDTNSVTTGTEMTTSNSAGFFYTDETFGGTNAFTNVRIYTGTITASRRIVVNGGAVTTTGGTTTTTTTTSGL